MTLQERLAQADNRPSGFDYMRVLLALAVVAEHTVGLNYGPSAQDWIFDYWYRFPFAMVLPMFFALSGFLVAGSLERSRTIVSFLGLRIVRLVPALAMETTLSAIILGSFFTTLPLGQYFTNPQFFAYFLNIVGEIHFTLPGVFNDLPLPGIVNMQLWTLPYELICYIVISVLALTTLVRRPYLFTALVVAIEAAEIFRRCFIKPFPHGITVGGPALVMSFLFGISLYLLRDRIPWSKWLFVLALIACILLGKQHSTSYALPLPAAYLTVYLGLTTFPRAKLLLSGDYSYGVYLYGFPIQQAIVALFPAHRTWWFNLILAYIVTGAFAVFSWWVVEKPVQDRRKVIFRFESWLMEKLSRMPLGGRLVPEHRRGLVDSRQ
jgi:peptidoglycan/LPS O-acetylase OafA/YrhL